MHDISTAERRRRLQTRQLLTPAGRKLDVAEVADAIVALHATDPATVYLSAWARMSAPTLEKIGKAMYDDKRLIRIMGMRRTMFVVSSELAPVVQASSSLGVAATQRRKLVADLQRAGIDDADRFLGSVSTSTLQALRGRGRASAIDLVLDEPRLGTVLDLAPDKSYAAPQKITSRVLTILALEGAIVRGRPLGGWTANRNEWWPAEAWLPDGLGALDVTDARIELVRRWLETFGPAPLTDLVWWTGWTLGQVRTALEGVVTVAVHLDGAVGVALVDDLDPTAEPDPAAALLPALDPAPMGWLQRDFFLGDHRPKLFDRTGNIGPTIFWQGRVVGGWAQRPDGEIRTALLEDIGAAGSAAVEARAAELADWLGPLRFTPRFRTPLERELST